MAGIATDGSPFAGRTSATPWRSPHDPLECKHCGSSLMGRRVGVKQQTTRGIATTTRGIATVVDVFKCRCSRERWISREVVAP